MNIDSEKEQDLVNVLLNTLQQLPIAKAEWIHAETSPNVKLGGYAIFFGVSSARA